MPFTAMELKVKNIIANGGLPRSRKVDALWRLRSDTRGVEWPGAESRAIRYDGVEDDLRVVEKALQQLGVDLDDGRASSRV